MKKRRPYHIQKKYDYYRNRLASIEIMINDQQKVVNEQILAHGRAESGSQETLDEFLADKRRLTEEALEHARQWNHWKA